MAAELLTQKIKELAIKNGACLIGIANLKLLKDIFAYPKNLLKSYKYGISIGINLDQYGSYDSRMVDKSYGQLEEIARNVDIYIQSQGYRSKVIPCDKRVKEAGPLFWRGEISHKAIARTAGLGWIGKSMLLITPNFGPRVFLITVLTDMPLVLGQPMKNKCGNCQECIKSCPLNALVEVTFADHPQNLKKVLDVPKCGPYVEKTWEKGNVCFNCLLACPYGMRIKGK